MTPIDSGGSARTQTAASLSFVLQDPWGREYAVRMGDESPEGKPRISLHRRLDQGAFARTPEPLSDAALRQIVLESLRRYGAEVESLLRDLRLQ